MKVKFFTVAGKTPQRAVYCRFWVGRDYDFKATTKIRVNKSDWNELKQIVKQKATTTQTDLINSKLKELELYIFDNWTKDNLNKTPISKDWLKMTVNRFFGYAGTNERYLIYFTDWVEKYYSNPANLIHAGKPLSYSTKQKYDTTLSRLKRFEKHTGTALRFADINLNFYNSFLAFCRDIDKLNNNTIGKDITVIKQFCKKAKLNGLPVNPLFEHSDFVKVSNETIDTYLNESEINKIFMYDFSNIERLDNARDLLIIGVWTGLRVSDFMRLHETNIKGGFIVIKTQKTGKTVTIPMHPQLKQILEKRNGEFPKEISPQRFNDYIKEVCEKVGITEPTEGAIKINIAEPGQKKVFRKKAGIYPKFELISSHTCRRSFATNLYNSGQVKPITIMQITGHTTESNFLKYIKTTPKEHAEKVLKYWNDQTNDKGIINVLRVAK